MSNYTYQYLLKRYKELSKKYRKRYNEIIKKNYAIERLKEKNQELNKKIDEKDTIIDMLYRELYK